MKIGIITYWHSDDNYGQQMQMFALQHYLRSKGHDAFLIRYLPENRPSLLSIMKSNIKLMVKHVMKHFSRSLHNRMLEHKQRIELSEQNKKNNIKRQFPQFRSEFINMTDDIYCSHKQLISNPPAADAYITGSDQVWHDLLTYPKTQCFFLQFGEDSAKRISYAASIGRQLEEKELSMFTKWLSSFTAVSVREESARQQCINAGINDTQLCIDPTLLLPVEYYMKNVEQKSCMTHCQPYLFMYILNISSAEEIAWKNVGGYITGKQLELKTVASSGYEPARELIPNNKNILATIPDWLSLIHHSECIVTTSFHGVVFSILYHRPFLAVLLTGKHEKANGRFYSLLGQLGLTERIYDSNKHFASQMDAPIDWQAVDMKAQSLGEEGGGFLKKALDI